MRLQGLTRRLLLLLREIRQALELARLNSLQPVLRDLLQPLLRDLLQPPLRDLSRLPPRDLPQPERLRPEMFVAQRELAQAR